MYIHSININFLSPLDLQQHLLFQFGILSCHLEIRLEVMMREDSLFCQVEIRFDVLLREDLAMLNKVYSQQSMLEDVLSRNFNILHLLLGNISLYYIFLDHFLRLMHIVSYNFPFIILVRLRLHNVGSWINICCLQQSNNDLGHSLVA